MEIPAFSIFSAISELFVTAGVLYAVISNLRGGVFRWKLLGLVLVFELTVNIVYMTQRASAADSAAELSTALKLFYAGHGILSLIMFLTLCGVYISAVSDLGSDRETWFRRHRSGSWILIFFWMVSVSTGEAIFVLRYLV